MTLVGAFGKAAGIALAIGIGLLLLPVLVLVAWIVFVARQPAQQVSEEPPVPAIRSRILHHTSAPGVV